MSVYEYLMVENRKIYSKSQIKKQFLEMGCTEYPKSYDEYEYIKKYGVIKSPEFINRINDVIRVPFYLPVLRSNKESYDIASRNISMPLVAFEWARRYFPGDTKIFWEIEGRKLFEGQVKNFFKKEGIKRDWLEEQKRLIGVRRSHVIK